MRRGIFRAMQSGDIVLFPAQSNEEMNRFMKDIEGIHCLPLGGGGEFEYRGVVVADTLTGTSYKAVRVHCKIPMLPKRSGRPKKTKELTP